MTPRELHEYTTAELDHINQTIAEQDTTLRDMATNLTSVEAAMTLHDEAVKHLYQARVKIDEAIKMEKEEQQEAKK